MIDPKDMEHCVEAIRHGSRSFHAASRLLPRSLRDPALALYAFCRLADDAVDLQDAKAGAVLHLHARLDAAYAGRPRNAPADRAFAAIIEDFALPRALPEALLEGLAWDAMGRQPEDFSDLRAYAARVAASVGAMMCVLMRVRDRDALARACDLGVAMQLTNIARDVGEDARAGRLYIPKRWMREAGLEPRVFLADPRMLPEVAGLIRRLLREADALYTRSEAGIDALPLACRPGIFAARHVYAGIGQAVRRNGHDSIGRRARTGAGQKLGWLVLSVLRAGSTVLMPRSPVIHARPLPETAFLVDAAADRSAGSGGWSEEMFAMLAGLKARDRAQKAGLMQSAARVRQTA